MEEIRLAKFINRCGVCSRREAEKLILHGRVKVNGKLVTELHNIRLGDQVEVDGTSINNSFLTDHKLETRLWLYHKPRGIITTHYDPMGRPTVFEEVSRYVDERVMSVGRLDINSEGLLLLSNSGALVRKLELPANNMRRVYMCRVLGFLSAENIEQAAAGLVISGVRYGKVIIEQTEVHEELSANKWLKFTLFEGKNREIRNICEYFGLHVNRLLRVSYGPFSLGSLKAGQISELHKSSFERYL